MHEKTKKHISNKVGHPPIENIPPDQDPTEENPNEEDISEVSIPTTPDSDDSDDSDFEEREDTKPIYTRKIRRFMSKMIRNLIVMDITKPFSKIMHDRRSEQELWTEEYINYLKKLIDDKLYYDIAEILFNIANDRGLFNHNAIDDAGGYTPNGLKLNAHSLWKLSLDRKNHQLPHFIPDKPYEYNLRFIPFGINTHTNAVELFDGDLRSEIVREINTPINHDKIRETIENERKSQRNMDGNTERRRYTWNKERTPHLDNGAWVLRIRDVNGKLRKISKSIKKMGSSEKAKEYVISEVKKIQEEVAESEKNRLGQKTNLLYGCMKGIWDRDEVCREHFGTKEKFRCYIFELLKQQQAICAISGIPLRGNNATGSEYIYRMSLDAIEPIKHHVEGNLRWVCTFLNSSNYDKVRGRSSLEHEDPTSWSPDLFSKYFRVKLQKLDSIDKIKDIPSKKERIVGIIKTPAGKYRAYCKRKGSNTGYTGYIGTFETEKEALIARNNFILNNETSSSIQDPNLATDIKCEIQYKTIYDKKKKNWSKVINQKHSFCFDKHFKGPTKDHSSRYVWSQAKILDSGIYYPNISMTINNYLLPPNGWEKCIYVRPGKTSYFKYKNPEGKIVGYMKEVMEILPEKDKRRQLLGARLACYHAILPYTLRAFYFRKWFIITHIEY
jgi:hypothetical protein